MTVGDRLKRFRKRKNLTQKQLGLAAGFDKLGADVRIAQYESGTRRPKGKYVERLAAIVGVQPSALEVPDINNYKALFQLLFALEDEYDLHICTDEIGLPYLMPKDPTSHESDGFMEWSKKHEQLKNGEITQEEYDEWRYNYPMSAARENHKKLMELWDKKKNGE